MADALWNDVKLLWHCDGPNDGLIHRDTSYNTLLGGAAVNKVAKKKFGPASAYYSGSSSTSVHHDTILNTQYADFTIECWINLDLLPVAGTGVTSYAPIISTRSNDDNRVLLAVVNLTGVTTGTGLYYVASDVGLTVSLAADFAFALDQWYHIAVCRSGNDWKLFIDGAVVASTTSSYRPPPLTTDVHIGAYVGFAGTSWFKGYMDEWRITHAARYTGAFTPATEQYSTDSLPQVADELPTYRDAEVVNLPFSKKAANATYVYNACSRGTRLVNGIGTNNPVISTVSPNFKNGSLEMDGSLARSVVVQLATPRINVANVDTSKYVIEFWLYPISAGGYHNFAFKLSTDNTARHSGNAALTLTLANGGLWYSVLGGGFNEANNISQTKLLTNVNQRWYHVAVEVSGSSQVKVYVDGVHRHTVNSAYYVNLISAYMAFGGAYAYAWSNYQYSYTYAACRISEFRMMLGVNRYNGKFIPPTRAIPESLEVDPHWGHVRLLMPMQALNNAIGTTDPNVAMDIKGHGMSASGGLGTPSHTLSTAVGVDRYAGGNWIEVAGGQQISGTHADFNLGTADWTIEFLYRIGTASQTKPILVFLKPNGTDWLCGVYEVAGTIVFKVGSSVSLSAGNATGGTQAFAHHSFSKVGGTLYAHRDGVLVGSAVSTDLLDMTTNDAISLFANTAVSGAPITGSLGSGASVQQFRMTIGVGRYGDASYTSIPYEMFPHESSEVISGVVRDSNGQPAARTVRCYHRDRGELIAETTSDAVTGAYSFPAQRAGTHYVLCLDESANALVYDHVLPAIIP